MSLLRVSSFGGGGVGQRFKLLCNKLVSFNEDKLTNFPFWNFSFSLYYIFFLALKLY